MTGIPIFTRPGVVVEWIGGDVFAPDIGAFDVVTKADRRPYACRIKALRYARRKARELCPAA